MGPPAMCQGPSLLLFDQHHSPVGQTPLAGGDDGGEPTAGDVVGLWFTAVGAPRVRGRPIDQLATRASPRDAAARWSPGMLAGREAVQAPRARERPIDQLAATPDLPKSPYSPGRGHIWVAHFVWENGPMHGPPHTEPVPPQSLSDHGTFVCQIAGQATPEDL